MQAHQQQLAIVLLSDLYIPTSTTMAGHTTSSTNGKENPLSQLKQVIASSLRPLPKETGDGTYVSKDTVTGLSKDLGHFSVKDVEALADVVKSAVTGNAVNDRDYVMEQVIQVCCKRIYLEMAFTQIKKLAAGLPSTSRNGKDLTNTFLNTLWNDLQHPPIS